MRRLAYYISASFLTFGAMMGGLCLGMIWFTTPHLVVPWFWIILGFYTMLTVGIGEGQYRFDTRRD